MRPISTTRQIDAPIEKVFAAVSDVRNFSEAVPHIVKVEFLTDQKTGVGTRFRETRLMGGKEASTELEVTEYVENDRVRIVRAEGDLEKVIDGLLDSDFVDEDVLIALGGGNDDVRIVADTTVACDGPGPSPLLGLMCLIPTEPHEYR